MKIKSRKTGGFTLIEMIVYVAFLAILSVVAIQGVVISLKALYAMRINQSINSSATTALERISREVHNAVSIDTVNSTLGSHPGRLTLNTKDGGGANTTIEFYVSGGQIGVKEGGVDKGSLVSKYATTTNLVFRRSTTTNSMAVKVELSLSDTRATSTVVKFYDTMVLRGSAH